MKLKKKSFLWLLMLGIGTMTLVQSCQKDPCEPCKNVVCDKLGFIAEEPFGCIVPHERMGTIGIQGDDGTFYHIRKDMTGEFANYEVGSYVKFGLCAVEDYDDGNSNINNGFWAVPKKIGDLGCLKIGHTTTDPNPCNQEAEVVSVSTATVIPAFGGRHLKIDGQVYAVRGIYADQIQRMAFGTKIHGTFNVTQDCILPAVITNPNVVGCVDATCLKESNDEECATRAQVTAVTYTPNGDPSSEHYLMVDNVVYSVQGSFRERINELPAGTWVTIGYVEIADCYLQMAITYPNVEGCIHVTCLKESIASQH